MSTAISTGRLFGDDRSAFVREAVEYYELNLQRSNLMRSVGDCVTSTPKYLMVVIENLDLDWKQLGLLIKTVTGAEDTTDPFCVGQPN